MQVTETIKYVGVNDHEIDLFEGQYDVRENGMAYNSYVIFGEKVAVTDTVDAHFVVDVIVNSRAAKALALRFLSKFLVYLILKQPKKIVKLLSESLQSQTLLIPIVKTRL